MQDHLFKLSEPDTGERSRPSVNRSETSKTDEMNSFSSPYIFTKRLKPKKTEVFDTYWRFSAKRQKIFFARIKSQPIPWTDDPILQKYRFTNAYRASDRVSQYLLSNVIYSKKWSLKDTVFRTLLFKFFNKIETWELLEHRFGEISSSTFNVNKFDECLHSAKSSKTSIYSPAYIMPSGSRKKYGKIAKHRFHLELLKELLDNKFHLSLKKENSLEGIFTRLKGVESLGKFLAYQYAIDLTYSPWFDFSENDYVVAGPGAKDGIRKCFSDLRDYNEQDIIFMMQDEQEYHFTRLGLSFDSLWGRPLHLIDCQNIFCEVDKYSRVAHPKIAGISGRTRIKQIYTPKQKPIPAWYPPKWGLNEVILRISLNPATRFT